MLIRINGVGTGGGGHFTTIVSVFTDVENGNANPTITILDPTITTTGVNSTVYLQGGDRYKSFLFPTETTPIETLNTFQEGTRIHWVKDLDCGITWGSDRWILDSNCSVTTANRPIYSSNTRFEGKQVYDTTINKVIVWSGTAWVNLDGTAL